MTAAKRPELPYEFLPEVPSFTVTSTDIADGQRMSLPQVVKDHGNSPGVITGIPHPPGGR